MIANILYERGDRQRFAEEKDRLGPTTKAKHGFPCLTQAENGSVRMKKGRVVTTALSIDRIYGPENVFGI